MAEEFLKIETGSHNGVITAMRVARGGRIVTAGGDKVVRVWSAETGREARKILGRIGPGGLGEIAHIGLAGDDALLIVAARISGSGEPDRAELRVHELASGNLIRRHEYPRWIDGMCVSPDQRWLAVVDNARGVLEVYDCARLASESVLAPAFVRDSLTNQPMRVCFVPHSAGLRVVTGNWSAPELTIYDLTDKGLVLVREAPVEGGARPDFFAANDRHVVVTDHDPKDVRVFDHELGPVLAIPTQNEAAGVAFNGDGSRLIVGTKRRAGDVLVRVYDSGASYTPVRAYAGHDARAQAVAFLDDGRAVSAGGNQFAIHIWDPEKPAAGAELEISGAGQVVYAAGLRAGRWIGFGNSPRVRPAEGTSAPLERAFDLVERKIVAVGPGDQAHFARAQIRRADRVLQVLETPWINLYLDNEPITGVPAAGRWYFAETFGFTPAGEVVTGDRDGTVRLIKTRARGPANLPGRMLIGSGGQLWDHAVEDPWLVTCASDQGLRLWYLPDARKAPSGTQIEPALNLFVSTSGEWVLWSRSGFYDASAHGDRYIGFHVNQGKDQEALYYPADRFLALLYRPDLIGLIFEEGSEERALTRAGLAPPDIRALLPPVVELIGPAIRTSDTLEVEVAFEIRPAAAPVDRVWILCNGIVVWSAVGEAAIQGSPQRVPLQQGPNEIRVMAESRRSKSLPAVLNVLAGGSRGTGDGQASPTTTSAEPVLGGVGQVVVDAGRPAVAGTVSMASLALDVTAAATGEARLTATRNGATIWTWNGALQPASTPLLVPVPLEPGSNVVSIRAEQSGASLPLVDVHVSAVNREREETLDLERRGAKGAVEPAPTEAAGAQQPPILYLLAVGVSKVKLPRPDFGLTDLGFAHADAESIVAAFMRQKGRLYSDVRTWVLTNEQATRAAIEGALGELAAEVGQRGKDKVARGISARDVVLVFLSGHGFNTEQGNEFFFFNYDLDLEHRDTTGIRLMDLGRVITSLPAEVILMTDACRAGMTGTELIRAIDPAVLGKWLSALNDCAQVIISATGRTTKSWEYEPWGHGLFTQAILDALDQRSDPEVNVFELADFVYQKVVTWSGNKQEPVWNSYNDVRPMALYRR